MYCDEALGVIEDLLHAIVHTFGLEGDALKEAREKLVDGWIGVYLRGLNEMLERGGDYFADNRLTVADLKVSGITHWLMSGQLDHRRRNSKVCRSPGLNDPLVLAYYAARG